MAEARPAADGDTPAGEMPPAAENRRAARADPLGQRFLAALAARAAAGGEPARSGPPAAWHTTPAASPAIPAAAPAAAREARLARAAAAFAERYAAADGEAGRALAVACARYPAAAAELQAMYAEGDFTALRRRIARLAMVARREVWAGLATARAHAQAAALGVGADAETMSATAAAAGFSTSALPGGGRAAAEQLESGPAGFGQAGAALAGTALAGATPAGTALAGATPAGSGQATTAPAGFGQAGAASAGTPAARPALVADTPKAIRHFRDTWLRLAAERQLAEALAEVPANAGPLNAQLLVQRALGRMHGISPDYLIRFLSWAEGLHWMDASIAPDIPAKKAKPR